jgi:peptide chain release factor 1
MEVLQARLIEKQAEEEHGEVSSERKSQIGTGDRSEKIKTYNFPQDRLTDHRIGKNYFGLKKIMDGEIEPMIEDYHQWVEEQVNS